MKTRRIIVSLVLFLAFGAYANVIFAQSGSVARLDYSDVRIKEFPIAMQCWTFHTITLSLIHI